MRKTSQFLIILAAFLLLAGCGEDPAAVTTTPTQTHLQTHPTQATTLPEETVPTTPDPTVTEPIAESFILSFAGDCTMGDNFDAEEEFGTFCKVVKEKYDYPFAKVKDIFAADDYSFVNLECALTESDPTEEEMEELKENRFRFRGPVEYAKILVEGNVEFASCANNHSKDYGKQGLHDTWDALEAENIAYASFGKTAVVTTESGLKIGVFTVFFNTNQASVEYLVEYLEKQGAELVIMSIHWGDEGTYAPNEKQVELGRMAIDAGVDIVFGHHSHTLQPVEAYHGGIIYYSLGNFSFGGNRNPVDKDTAIIQQQVLRYADGTVALGDLIIHPCSVSGDENWNNYQPTPYDPEDEGYSRVFTKLEGSYDGDQVDVPYATDPTE